MSRFALSRSLLACCLLLVVAPIALLTGCSRDPNVRKQKYFESGERYFADGKYREAQIQYLNAIKIDSRFAQAHYQLAQSFLKLGDSNRAFQELNLTVQYSSPSDGFFGGTSLFKVKDEAKLKKSITSLIGAIPKMLIPFVI